MREDGLVWTCHRKTLVWRQNVVSRIVIQWEEFWGSGNERNWGSTTVVFWFFGIMEPRALWRGDMKKQAVTEMALKVRQILSGSCRLTLDNQKLTNITLFPQTSKEMSRCVKKKAFHQRWKKLRIVKVSGAMFTPALSSWISERGKSLIKSLSAHKKSLGESWLAEQLISLKLSKIKIHGRHQCRVAEQLT